jgi:hypothetical protein
MKQHITEDQLNQLSDKNKKKLIEWIYDHDYEDNLIWYEQTCGEDNCCSESRINPLSIGQMIEFMDGNFINFWRGKRDDWLIIIDDDKHIVKKELVDALWDAVKEVLNENTT